MLQDAIFGEATYWT